MGKTAHLSIGVNNLFDTRYSNYGALAYNNITTGSAEQFRALGAPRGLWLALGARF
jgi:outer membrane receptor protein involved in Fe transport